MRTLLDFVLDDTLGQGSGAIVHRARRLPGGETVALKCPKDDSVDASRALEHEASLLGRIRHPNVARLIELVRMSDADPPVGLAIEFIDGPTLAELADGPPIGAPRLAAIGADVARGLEALHDVGVIHGDVKPANVLIRPSGQAVLVDLDSAVDLAGNDHGRTPLRVTTRFAAPESLERGERTPASDLWSLATILQGCLDPDQAPTDQASTALRDLISASLVADPCARPTLTQVIDGLDRVGAVRSDGAATLDETGSQPADRREDVDLGPKGDPTIVWRPVRPRSPGPPRPPGRSPKPGLRLGAGRVALTLVGVALGVTGAIALFGWAADAVEAPRPSLAGPPDRVDRPTDESVAEPVDESGDAPPSEPNTVIPSVPGAERESAPPCAGADGSVEDPGGLTSEVRQLSADLRGEGCERTVSWDPVTARATVAWPEGVRRYALGQPGDQLVLGDWDADGRATPALYRPSTGDTFTFSGWADPDQPLPSAEVQATGVRDGRAVARTAIAGTADHLVVEEGGP